MGSCSNHSKFTALIITVYVVLHLFCVGCNGKECTNSLPSLNSHSLRYQMSESNNETWVKEVLEHYHLTPSDETAWASLLPRKILKEGDELQWELLYKQMKNNIVYDNNSNKPANGDFLKEVSLHDVRLEPNSVHWRAQQTNLEYLLLLDVDSLVWNFRNNSGLSAPGNPYGGWERPNQELRGHFVGHYMSATAKMWASTHNETLKEKMSALVSALSACQVKIGSGYLSAFPTELFDRLESLTPVWAPYYTIHKIMAGLLDQHNLAGSDQALKMVVWMADYFYNRVRNVILKYSIERHWRTLNDEAGGMNDVLYQLYLVTGDQKHMMLAHLFDKPCFLGMLGMKVDSISGFHSNTHIPIVVGTQMRYEITGDPLYKDMGIFFMDTVNSSHSYATGGTSVGEFWSDPKRLASTLGTENEESCTTYNMLKVSRHLFRWTKEMAYADYYERALTNGVLSIQRGNEPGIMIYMLPLAPGQSKAKSYHGWGSKFNDFWCCYGTGIESFSKLGDSIYFEEDGNVPGLYVIQYISSSFDWKKGNILLNQKVEPVVSWDNRLRVTFTVSSNEEGAAQSANLNFRIPFWAHSNGGTTATAALNGQDISLPAPGNFLSVNRKWSDGDKITLVLPINLRTEVIQDDRAEYASVKAILYGPYLLAGMSTGEWDIGTKSAESISDWIVPVPALENSNLVTLSQESGNSRFVITNSINSITMEHIPKLGTNEAARATFKLILLQNSSFSSKFSSPKEAVGKSVMLEPFDFPGKLLVQQGTGQDLVMVDDDKADGSVFRLVEGLDGKKGSVSLESESEDGCFMYSGGNYESGINLKLKCDKSSDSGFKEATSFTLSDGVSEYHPISFIAKGMKRNFVLAPLYSLRDENYTVYFNIRS